MTQRQWYYKNRPCQQNVNQYRASIIFRLIINPPYFKVQILVFYQYANVSENQFSYNGTSATMSWWICVVPLSNACMPQFIA